ncbi:carboxylesterase family protein [Microbacterium sp. NPDC096154]|uniref:carboxylesterase family protein n=1 Tax=Microbacterium sp. NPDC096154 TaxID=3155549 RepID=UPI003333C6FA
MTDVVVRYGERLDPSDRFSELSDRIPDVVVERPLAFPQRPGSLNPLLGGANGELPQSHDAFQLRVQAPDGAVGAPVVVFIPGGGFMTGTGNARWFTSPELVEQAGIVLVTVNYRIGVLGHLGPEGDPLESQRGLRDLLHAIDWVVARIAAFGGDPDNITLAGDSAGAWYAYALSTLPDTEGLFARTALISLPREAPLTADAYAQRRAVLLDALGGDLREASADAVLEAQGALARTYAGKGMALMPAAAGPIPAGLHDFAASAPRLHVRELLLLSTSEEAAAFLFPAPDEAFPPPAVDGFLGAKFAGPAAAAAWIDAKRPDASPKQRMIEAMTLHQFRLAHLELAAAAGIPTYVASFGVQSPLRGAGSPHCFPLPFLFGERAVWHDAPMLAGLGDEVFDVTSAALREWFVGFARTGEPAGQPPFDPASPQRLEFGGAEPHLLTPTELSLVAR